MSIKLTFRLINIKRTLFVRWLYTAMTRATGEAFLMNFNPQFFT